MKPVQDQRSNKAVATRVVLSTNWAPSNFRGPVGECTARTCLMTAMHGHDNLLPALTWNSASSQLYNHQNSDAQNNTILFI
jgi:hypothetical protein